MQCIDFAEPGAPDVLKLATLPTPVAGPGEVLLKVAAAGVNRPDCLQRRGLYPPPPGASPLLGLEVAGQIVACGDGVTQFSPGDKICALLAGGGYAEYCVAPAVQCLPVPAGLSLRDAATLPETFFTVWTNLYDSAKLQPGETLLVHGGASGIGTTAIQMAKALGSIVYATAGTPAKTRLCEELGAVRAINYNSDDFLVAIKEAAGGVDVVLDIVGGSHLEKNVKLLNPNGRLVTIGILGGAKGTLNLGLVLTKRLIITGSTLRARSPAEKQTIGQNLVQTVWPHIASRNIRPVIQHSYALADAALAHEQLEANQAAGKFVLLIDEALAAHVVS